jgi:hypothetical protein
MKLDRIELLLRRPCLGGGGKVLFRATFSCFMCESGIVFNFLHEFVVVIGINLKFSEECSSGKKCEWKS